MKEAGGQAYSYQIDLTKREDVYKTAERVKKEVGTVCGHHCLYLNKTAVPKNNYFKRLIY